MRERRHGGDAPEGVVDLSAPLNPLGPPRWALEAAARGVAGATRYPDPSYRRLREALAEIAGAPDAGLVVPLNGAAEALTLALAALRPRRVLAVEPTFGDHAVQANAAGVGVEALVMPGLPECRPRLDVDLVAARASPGDLVIVSNPNNPTGLLAPRRALEELASRLPRGAVLLVDEAFIRLSDPQESLAPDPPPGTIVVGSLTKDLALPGVRLGYATGDPRIAERLEGVRQAWNVNSAAVAVGLEAAARRRELEALLAEARRLAREGLQALLQGLEGAGVQACPTRAPYVLLHHPHARHPGLQEALHRRGFHVRDAGSFAGLDPGYSRVSLASPRVMEGFAAALREALGEAAPAG